MGDKEKITIEITGEQAHALEGIILGYIVDNTDEMEENEEKYKKGEAVPYDFQIERWYFKKAKELEDILQKRERHQYKMDLSRVVVVGWEKGKKSTKKKI